MPLIDDAQAVLGTAERLYASTPQAAEIGEIQRRFAEPLRVAIAGKIKAGKSTLLNALVGERLAPTDAGECTKVVTWYKDGHTYRVIVESSDGEETQLPFRRDDGALDIDLGGRSLDAIRRLEVTWPSSTLQTITLIDTPGIGSLSESVSQRSWTFVGQEDEATPADAVVYLMKHLHANDIDFLEAFHDVEVSQPNPVNAIAILSRADEIGVGRLDSMASARRIAARYRNTAKVRRLVQTVVPVAGLLAETAASLTEGEYRALRTIAELGPKDAERLLISADRFVNTPGQIPLTDLERQHLLERFGIFGVRLASTLIRRNTVANARELAEELLQRSGLVELRELLDGLFVGRRDVLKARSALFALDVLARAHPVAGSDELLADLERVIANAHEFAELRLISSLRSGWIDAKPELLTEMERILGSNDPSVSARLGLEPDADQAAVLARLGSMISEWQRRAENPMTSHNLAVACRVIIRSCEGMLAAVATPVT